jgi:hypothetical protein
MTMASHKPICQQWQVFSLNFGRKQKEVPRRCAAAPCSTAVTWPGRAPGDIDIVVAREFFASGYVATSHNVRRVGSVPYIRVRITAVVYMSIRKANENNFAVRVIAMIEAFSELFT